MGSLRFVLSHQLFSLSDTGVTNKSPMQSTKAAMTFSATRIPGSGSGSIVNSPSLSILLIAVEIPSLLCMLIIEV